MTRSSYRRPNTPSSLRPGFEFWYRLLTLFTRALSGEHEFVGHDLYANLAWQLRLRLVSIAATTSKLTLDACLAGYYTQAFGLTRHVIETWKVLAFLELVPTAARGWFVGDDGAPPPDPDRRIINQTLAESKRYAKAYRQVKELITFLHRHAHPSSDALAQTMTGKPGLNQLGANFNPYLATSVIDVATFASLIVLQQLAHRIDEEPPVWNNELRRIEEDRDTWIAQRDFPPSATR